MKFLKAKQISLLLFNREQLIIYWLQSEGDIFLTECTMSAFEDLLSPQLSLLCLMDMDLVFNQSILGNGFRILPVPKEMCFKALNNICPFLMG